MIRTHRKNHTQMSSNQVKLLQIDKNHSPMKTVPLFCEISEFVRFRYALTVSSVYTFVYTHRARLNA